MKSTFEQSINLWIWGKYFSLLLITNPLSKNLTPLTPSISQFSKQDIEKLPLKNKIDSRERALD